MRPLWSWFAFVLALALSTSLLLAEEAKRDALRRSGAAAEYLARTELAVLLEPADLVAPVRGERAKELERDIDERITSPTRIQQVRIYSSLGRILFAEDAGIVGTRPTYLRELTFEIANGEAPVSQIHLGSLQTFVPLWLSPSGPVVVAELSQTFGPIASEATARWHMVALAGAALLLCSLAMIVVTSLAPRRATRVPVGRPHPSARVRPQPSHGPGATAPAARLAPPGERKELDDALGRIAELERQMDRTQRALEDANARLQSRETPAFGHDEIEITAGAVDELSIRRSGTRSRPRTTRSSHG